MSVGLVKEENGLAIITLDRPERRNALSPREHHLLQDLCAELRSDFATRVVILTGAGGVFSAGADLSSPREAGPPSNDLERRHRARIGDRTVAALDGLDQITIAAIDGHCIGGGAVLALACDMRVMSPGAWLRLPEIELGMPLTWGALPLLMREIGPARTIELVTTCDRIEAADALRWGLVNQVGTGPALATARELAARILRQPAVPVAMTKSVVRGLRAGFRQGDLTEADGDLYWLAIRTGGLAIPEKHARKKSDTGTAKS